MLRSFLLSAMACIALAACSHSEPISLSPIISDGMVLQQSSDVTVWGFASPGTKVTLDTDWGFSMSATTGPRKYWYMSFSTLPVDGLRHQLVFSTADTTVVVRDVMFGEVWLASGQSNMEMPLCGWGSDTVANAANVIAAANDSLLRFFTVQRNVSVNWDISNLSGQWLHASPENAPDFSAAAYFFAQNLRDSLQVPVGVVVSTWGGTPIESWIDKKTMLSDSLTRHLVPNLDTLASDAKKLEVWLRKRQSVPLTATDTTDQYENIDIDPTYVFSTDYNDLQWRETRVPGYWSGDYDGVVWMVKRVVVPKSWKCKPLLLCLGAIDDRDVTYVNGTEVGRTMKDGQYNFERIYEVPASLVNDTLLQVAVKVVDTGANGGITGFTRNSHRDNVRIECPDLNASVSLEGDWKYAVAAEFYEDYAYLNDVSENQFNVSTMPVARITEATPTALYTGMIEPIANYKFRGAIWYQGETNVGAARNYFVMQQQLVKSWRQVMGDDLAFYYVQIAPYSYSDCNDVASARLREAQRRAALEIEHCDLISTLDIGSSETIHPSNKLTVGQRLAAKALYYDYGFANVKYSGPVLESVEGSDHLIAVTFSNAEGLYIDTSKPNLFEVAGEDGIFYSATTIISDNQLTLFSHHVAAPIHARYAAYNCVDATLFNAAGLPALTFCTCELQD